MIHISLLLPKFGHYTWFKLNPHHVSEIVFALPSGGAVKGKNLLYFQSLYSEYK
jgi:hypothetical protein